jgi:hypothetical protein
MGWPELRRGGFDMRYVHAWALVLFLPAVAFSRDFDEALRLFLSRSDVVVRGEFKGKPVRGDASFDIVTYEGDFEIAECVKVEAPAAPRVGTTIKVQILAGAEDEIPELKKGGKCLLFLECQSGPPNPSYVTVDPWFGVQRSSPALAKAIASMLELQKRFPVRVPDEKDIEQFYPDPVRRDVHFKNFKVERADLARILREYRVVTKYHWTHNYSHVGTEDRTGTILLRDSSKIAYMVRPGGLATLTFLDGRRIYLAREE